jgi:hypothetical protein
VLVVDVAVWPVVVPPALEDLRDGGNLAVLLLVGNPRRFAATAMMMIVTQKDYFNEVLLVWFPALAAIQKMLFSCAVLHDGVVNKSVM